MDGKSREKLRNIIRGCRLNDKIFLKAVAGLREKKFGSEKALARFIDSEIRKAGARNAFPAIVAIGKNAVQWHHRPGKTRLRRGFLVIDFGSRFNGYCSDMTRTLFIGKASAAEKKIYSRILEANVKCIKKVRAGADGNEIYRYARKILGGYARYFGHGLGHGLGKRVHAKPRLSKKRAFLKEFDVVTIEPGVYIPRRLGIRIEDDVLVKRNGYKLLSKSGKKFVEINLE